MILLSKEKKKSIIVPNVSKNDILNNKVVISMHLLKESIKKEIR